MSLIAISVFESSRRQFFKKRRISCKEIRNERFLSSGGRNESNRHYLVRTGEIIIFHELDVHHV